MTSDPYGSPADPRTVRRPVHGPPPQTAPAPLPPSMPPGLDPDRWGPRTDVQPAPPRPTGGPGGNPPRGRRRRIWIAVIAAVALVGGAVVATVVLTNDDGPNTKPGDTVRTYLHDLAAADAADALAQGRPPASTLLLTDQILRRQQEVAPISAVRIVRASTDGDHAQVRATYRFGSRTTDQTFPLTRHGDGWQLDHTTFTIDVSMLAGIPAPTVFGKPVGGVRSIVVFPGPVQWGSGNRYFAVTQKNADRFALGPTDPTASYAEITTGFNPAGTTALRTAVSDYVTACAASRSLHPRQCPQEALEEGVVPDTARWTLRTPLTSAVKFHPSSDEITTVEVEGTLAWTCSYQAHASKRKIVTRTDRSIQSTISGTIDLTAATPAFTPT